MALLLVYLFLLVACNLMNSGDVSNNLQKYQKK